MRSYKLTHLIFSFALLITLSAALLVGMIFQHIENISIEHNNFQHSEAKHELSISVTKLKNELKKMQAAISDWGETKQQLASNEFYQIWKEDRVPVSGILHPKIKNIALYDKNGKILGLPQNNDISHLKIILGKAYVQKEMVENDENWLYIFPIEVVDLTGLSESKIITLGYASIFFSLKEFLSSLNHFKLIDINSLMSTYNYVTPFYFDSIESSLKYDIIYDQYIQQLISSTNGALFQVLMFVVFAMIVVVIFIQWLLVKPLKNISSEVNSSSSSKTMDSEFSLAPQPILELDRLSRSFNDYQARLIASNKSLELNNKEFFRIAHEDSLTGAFNRRAFEDDWLEDDKQVGDRQYAILIFDCDNFKPINDSYGHAVGDAVIKNISNVLTKTLEGEGKLYRLGGDEFSTIISRQTQNEILSIAETCRDNVLKHDFRKYGLSESVSVSVGIAVSKLSKNSFTTIMKQADLAMYKAKKPGESSIVFYSDDLSTEESVISTNAVNAVFAAINDPSKISVRYQPVVSLPSLDESYVEALVTVKHDNATYMPNVIFPVVEGRNLDVEFDLSVISAIENDLKLGAFQDTDGISLNLSGPSVINTRVIDLLLKIKITYPKIKLIIEITETALITQIEKASINISQLRDSGYLVALDDFGSGYSSLRYLTSMPVDIIKFDITLIHLLESENDDHRNMIEKLAELIIDLDYEVVAEGIETQSLLDKVIALGFSYSQGYFTGRPAELN